MSESASTDRWNTYVLYRGLELEAMLADHFASKKRKLAFILGKGFDPRMNRALELVARSAGSGAITVFLISFDEGEHSPSGRYVKEVEANVAQLKSIVPSTSMIEKSLKMRSTDGRRQTSKAAERVFTSLGDVAGFTDIIVDISALPRSVYFSVVAKLLHLIDDANEARVNLAVFVTEEPALDRRIVEEGIDEDADYVHPFRGGADREATARLPRVWYPILGENQTLQLERISQLIDPHEICPVIPAPSREPRRGDDLIIEYRNLLFETFRAEPRNFLFASELNPFEAYRQIRRTLLHYDAALKPLGGCRHILSALSSKLLSMAALLVAYEAKQSKIDVGIAHIESDGYSIQDYEAGFDNAQSIVNGLWLCGEFYVAD